MFAADQNKLQRIKTSCSGSKQIKTSEPPPRWLGNVTISYALNALCSAKMPDCIRHASTPSRRFDGGSAAPSSHRRRPARGRSARRAVVSPSKSRLSTQRATGGARRPPAPTATPPVPRHRRRRGARPHHRRRRLRRAGRHQPRHRALCPPPARLPRALPRRRLQMADAPPAPPPVGVGYLSAYAPAAGNIVTWPAFYSCGTGGFARGRANQRAAVECADHLPQARGPRIVVDDIRRRRHEGRLEIVVDVRGQRAAPVAARRRRRAVLRVVETVAGVVVRAPVVEGVVRDEHALEVNRRHMVAAVARSADARRSPSGSTRSRSRTAALSPSVALATRPSPRAAAPTGALRIHGSSTARHDTARLGRARVSPALDVWLQAMPARVAALRRRPRALRESARSPARSTRQAARRLECSRWAPQVVA